MRRPALRQGPDQVVDKLPCFLAGQVAHQADVEVVGRIRLLVERPDLVIANAGDSLRCQGGRVGVAAEDMRGGRLGNPQQRMVAIPDLAEYEPFADFGHIARAQCRAGQHLGQQLHRAVAQCRQAQGAQGDKGAVVADPPAQDGAETGHILGEPRSVELPGALVEAVQHKCRKPRVGAVEYAACAKA